MRAAGARWAISFADLCLLLLGFLIIVQARPERVALAAGVRDAFREAPPARADLVAARLFERGEAVLTPAGRATIARFAGRVGTSRVQLVSSGADLATTRLDGWELAAARAAAVARALVAAGVSEERIGLAIERADGHPQRLVLTSA